MCEFKCSHTSSVNMNNIYSIWLKSVGLKIPTYLYMDAKKHPLKPNINTAASHVLDLVSGSVDSGFVYLFKRNLWFQAIDH